MKRWIWILVALLLLVIIFFLSGCYQDVETCRCEVGGGL